jgi:hypothetical protein
MNAAADIAPAMRTIDTTGFAAIVVPAQFGRVPRLDWIAISALVIDPEYQREISFVGRRNVRHIATNFNWAMFTPVIVASLGGNRFAIVDGQHRTTAAALCLIEKVPCAIIEAVRGEQAAAFRAINGNTTRLHTVQLFHAAALAGEPRAITVNAVCKAGGVTIARSLGVRKRCHTFAVSTIGRCIERRGEKLVTLALRLIVHSGDGRPEELSKSIIHAVVEVLALRPAWVAAERALMDGFAELCLEDLATEAASTAARIRGKSGAEVLQETLIRKLAALMPAPAKGTAGNA